MTKPNEYDVVIVGGGPAGLSAALYTSRMNLKSLLIEKNIIASQLYETETIDNYLGAFSEKSTDLAAKMEEDAQKYGAQLMTFKEVTSIKKDINGNYLIKIKDSYGDETEEIYSKSILLATGTTHTHLLVDNHDKYLANGISYCATCDGAFFVDEKVAVVGGGDSALEAALLLAEYATSVKVLVRSKLRAKPHLINLASKNPKIEFIYGEVKKLIGESSLEKIILNDERELDVKGLFVNIGARPNYSYIDKDELTNVAIIDDYLLPKIKTDSFTTQVGDGLFVAGDLKNNKYRQVSIAVGEGTYAALEIYDYLRGQ